MAVWGKLLILTRENCNQAIDGAWGEGWGKYSGMLATGTVFVNDMKLLDPQKVLLGHAYTLTKTSPMAQNATQKTLINKLN